MTTTEDVITHCARCKCADSIACLTSLCRCSQCSCDVDADGVEDVTLLSLRMWKLVYGGGERGKEANN